LKIRGEFHFKRRIARGNEYMYGKKKVEGL